MANLSHVLQWDDVRKFFFCRTGACSFTRTFDEVRKAGYTPHTTGVLLVRENDFPLIVPITQETTVRCG